MKYILIFNGYPKSGKTTFQNMIAEKYNSYIFSSIKPVIDFLDDIIEEYGDTSLKERYTEEKNKKSDFYRKLLSDTKLSVYDFDNGNFWNTKIFDKVNLFLYDNLSEFFMIDIREPKHIESFLNFSKKIKGYGEDFKVFTIFMNANKDSLYLNESDSNVEKYKYDFYVNNKWDLKTLREKVLPEFINKVKNK